MNCQRCAGLMIGEEVQVVSGRFQGWRCVQCGLWLDQTIVRNRVETPPAATAIHDAPEPGMHFRRSARSKRAANGT